MHDAAKREYEVLAQLGDETVNAALLTQLDTKIAIGHASAGVRLMRANLLRRSGALAETRAELEKLLRDPHADGFTSDVVIPAGLTTQDCNYIAPLILIDNVLPESEMKALYRHACEIEGRFRHARISSGDHPYDPDKRETLLAWDFEGKRQHFLDFVEHNLERFQDALGFPRFTAERYEIKLTNHLDGGFFNTHRDNHNAPNAPGRALTWLYYFSALPPRFSGGELFILDSNPTRQQASASFFTKVKPRPNRFVAFPSWYYHAVGPTRVPGNRFADGRFAISGHVHKPADKLEWRFL